MTASLRAVVHEVHEGEVELEQELHVVADRHRTDHEVRHVAVDLARWSLRNREALAPVLARWDAAPDTHAHAGSPVVHALRERTAELMGRRDEPGLLLLRDLRRLHLMAEGNAVLWTLLSQAAKATQDTELLQLVTPCLDRSSRQAVWCTSTLKVLGPQVLSAV